MLARLYEWILASTGVLYAEIWRSPWFFLDLWSIVHLVSGALLALGLLAVRRRRPLATLFLILVAYEVAELGFVWLAVRLFRPEILPDQVTDVVVGMIGGAVVWCARRNTRGARA